MDAGTFDGFWRWLADCGDEAAFLKVVLTELARGLASGSLCSGPAGAGTGG